MKNPSRKYVDLIYASSLKWANWDPPNQIKVGDYGTVNRETGQFETDGNIYEDVATAQLAAQHLPCTSAPEDSFIVSSMGVKSCVLENSAELQIPGLCNLSIKGQWEFGANRSALLIMARPCSSYLPRQVLLKQLVDVSALKDKALVTEVITCPAYSLYLSSANNETIDVALVGVIPVTPTVNAGGEIKASWKVQNTAGLSRCACDNSGSRSFTPLYTLKKIRRQRLLRRESPDLNAKNEDRLWVDVQKPWDPGTLTVIRKNLYNGQQMWISVYGRTGATMHAFYYGNSNCGYGGQMAALACHSQVEWLELGWLEFDALI